MMLGERVQSPGVACPRRIGRGGIIKSFKKKILKRLSGWSRHIDPGLVQEDGLGYISISLPATLCLFWEKFSVHCSHPPAATGAAGVVLVAVTRIRAGISEGT